MERLEIVDMLKTWILLCYNIPYLCVFTLPISKHLIFQTVRPYWGWKPNFSCDPKYLTCAVKYKKFSQILNNSYTAEIYVLKAEKENQSRGLVKIVMHFKITSSL